MRGRSTRNPLVSFALFLILCGMGFVAWEKRGEIRWGGSGEAPPVDAALTESVLDAVLEQFGDEDCFVELRGGLMMRPREERFRLEITVSSGRTCEDASTTLCKRIAHLIRSQSGYVATVVAYDSGDRQVGRYVQ